MNLECWCDSSALETKPRRFNSSFLGPLLSPPFNSRGPLGTCAVGQEKGGRYGRGAHGVSSERLEGFSRFDETGRMAASVRGRSSAEQDERITTTLEMYDRLHLPA
jgi:hypothetical protein